MFGLSKAEKAAKQHIREERERESFREALQKEHDKQDRRSRAYEFKEPSGDPV